MKNFSRETSAQLPVRDCVGFIVRRRLERLDPHRSVIADDTARNLAEFYEASVTSAAEDSLVDIPHRSSGRPPEHTLLLICGNRKSSVFSSSRRLQAEDSTVTAP